MKYRVPKEHYFRMYKKATTFLVYSYLVCCAGNKGSCWPSLETISRKTGLSVSTVQEHLKILEQRQLISKSRHRVNGEREKNNVYTLLSLDNPEVYRSPAPVEALPLGIGEETPV